MGVVKVTSRLRFWNGLYPSWYTPYTHMHQTLWPSVTVWTLVAWAGVLPRRLSSWLLHLYVCCMLYVYFTYLLQCNSVQCVHCTDGRYTFRTRHSQVKCILGFVAMTTYAPNVKCQRERYSARCMADYVWSLPTTLASKVEQSVMTARPFVSTLSFCANINWSFTEFFLMTCMAHDRSTSEIESQGQRSASSCQRETRIFMLFALFYAI